MTKPNLFIVGAPKCGTTALYTYLQSHPEIFFPDFKEPHYFGRDLRKRPDVFVLDSEAYMALFDAGDGKAIRGEASTNYIFSESAPREIQEFSPDARILLMLRAPVDQLYSSHAQYLWSGNEDIEDFWAALEAETDRLSGSRLPRGIDIRQKVFYQTNLRKIPSQLRTLRNLFGAGRVKVILLEDLKKGPTTVYGEVLEFLQLEYVPCPSFSVVNASKALRSRKLRSLIRRIEGPLGMVRNAFAKRPIGVTSFLHRLNTRERPRPPLDTERRRLLAHSYADWTKELEDLLGRDLTHWLL